MKKNGNIIAELRREAGYTQKALAEAMNITDKAISKWERGLSLPDVALLPRLSALLDADIELLLQKATSGLHKEWAGLIDLRHFNRDMTQFVYDKPMVYYILSHFLLIGVRKIYVLGDAEKQSWLKWEQWGAMGIDLHPNPKEMPKDNLMIMRHPVFLFGADLTRRYQAAMSTGKVTKLCPAWDITPFLFCPAEFSFMYYKNPSYLYDNAILKTLGRGMVCIPMDTAEQVNDAASFVRMYQNTTGLALQDIHEIAGQESRIDAEDE